MDERTPQQLGRKRLPLVVRRVGWTALVALLLTAAFFALFPLFVTPRGSTHVVTPGTYERNRRYDERVRESNVRFLAGDLDQAEARYLRIIEEFGYSSRLSQHLARMYEKQGRKAEALARYAEILNPPPQTWTSLSESPEILGRTLELATELGRADLADQALANVLRTGLAKPIFSDLPVPETADEKLAAAHLIVGVRSSGVKDEEALRHYVAATELDPTLTKAWFFKGQALRGLGRYAEAKQALEKARHMAAPGTKQAEFIEEELRGIFPDGTVLRDGRRVVGGRLVTPP
ncbi:MAG: tetratricopeptide repeat protein [Fimbriimonadaceae bacterium]|nr:tetratricopeptide repeat protein [Fimbriimonadaceae bacterium]